MVDGHAIFLFPPLSSSVMSLIGAGPLQGMGENRQGNVVPVLVPVLFCWGMETSRPVTVEQLLNALRGEGRAPSPNSHV
jgi:hypothetical protein